jgi:hypothetical protein
LLPLPPPIPFLIAPAAPGLFPPALDLHPSARIRKDSCFRLLDKALRTYTPIAVCAHSRPALSCCIHQLLKDIPGMSAFGIGRD